LTSPSFGRRNNIFPLCRGGTTFTLQTLASPVDFCPIRIPPWERLQGETAPLFFGFRSALPDGVSRLIGIYDRSEFVYPPAEATPPSRTSYFEGYVPKRVCPPFVLPTSIFTQLDPVHSQKNPFFPPRSYRLSSRSSPPNVTQLPFLHIKASPLDYRR